MKRTNDREDSNKLVTDGFTNPYAFVRLPVSPSVHKPPVPHDRYDPGLLSGHLRVRIDTLTPLFTSDGGNEGAPHLEMAQLNGWYAIPGSGLKGVIRSFAETITGSCLRVLGSPGVHSYRPEAGGGATLRHPFVIETDDSGSMTLRSLTSAPLPVRPKRGGANDLTSRAEGDTVRFTLQRRRAYLSREGEAGTLKLSDVAADGNGRTDRRNQYVVWPGENSRTGRPHAFDDMIAAYNYAIAPSIAEDRREFVDEPGPFGCGRNLSQQFVERWGKRKRRHELAVDDIVWGNHASPDRVTMIGPVQVARRRYDYATEDATPQGFEPCDNPRELCWACRVFGMASDTGEKQTPGRSGHVRIGWALGPAVSKLTTEKIGLPRMESPKPAYGPFYLSDGSGNAATWDDEAEIAGRKFYWHWANADPLPTNEQPELVVSAVPARTMFEADVRFDNLSAADFGLLLAALDPRLLGEGWDGAGHKIGMGKPLGLGSITTTITEAILVDRATRYGSLEPGNETPLDVTTDLCQYVSEFDESLRNESDDNELLHIEDLRILSTHGPTGTITWPRGRHGSAKGFEWFQDNRNRAIPLPLPSETKEGRRLPRL